MRSLSKSTKSMFLFDLLILLFSTYYCAKFFNYTPIAIILLYIFVVYGGLLVLYLKGNYEIREADIIVKNAYLIFEDVLMSHVLPVAYALDEERENFKYDFYYINRRSQT